MKVCIRSAGVSLAVVACVVGIQIARRSAMLTEGRPTVASVNSPSSSFVVPDGHPESLAQPIPSWAVAFGREFWRQPATAAAGGHDSHTNNPSRPQGMPPIDLGQVMDRITPAISTEPGSSVPIARADTYAVNFDKGAIRVSAYGPVMLPEAQRPAAAMAIEERRMQRQSPPPQALA